MFHLGWFLPGWGIQTDPAHGWSPSISGPWAGQIEREWMRPDLCIDLAASLERGGFDFILIEDSNQVDSTFRGSAEATLRMGIFAPKNDPMPLVPLLTARTRHIGIVPTISSTFYPPYLAARLLTTLDHLSDGRVGFNVVTSLSGEAALNYGLDALPPKNIRYDMANEWVDVVKGLQGSWEPDAVVADVANGVFADYRKVHRLDYVGKYFSCRGPLNTVPGPQGVMPMVEAGNSPAGRDLAARHASAMLAVAQDVDQMKAFRSDMHERLRHYGRDTASCKIMFLVSPVIGATDEDAHRKQEALNAKKASDAGIETMLWFLDQMTGLDFGGFPLDAPVAEIVREMKDRSAENISSMDMVFQGNEHRTLREALSSRNMTVDLGLIGSPHTIAAKMKEIMEEVGGDGFLFTLPANRHSIAEVTDGLCPVLQRAGLIRSEYGAKTFRENLLAF